MPIGWRVYGELRKKRKKKRKRKKKPSDLNLSREKKKETRSFVRSLDGEEGIFFFFYGSRNVIIDRNEWNFVIEGTP